MQQLSQSSDMLYKLTGPPLLDEFLEPECLSEWLYSKIPSPKEYIRWVLQSSPKISARVGEVDSDAGSNDEYCTPREYDAELVDDSMNDTKEDAGGIEFVKERKKSSLRFFQYFFCLKKKKKYILN